MGLRAALKQFTFDKVIHLISARYATQKRVLLTLLLDDCSQVPLPLLREMISTLVEFMLSGHQLGVCVVPQLSGKAQILQ
jgi:hypothetical protein